MAAPTKPLQAGLDASLLDRNSFVPLYYQLQEVLKERIESGLWRPGDAIPSEPELASALGVSRVVVRQALAILEDDRQIVRLKGTFVARTKLDARAGGLSRLLATPRPSGVSIKVLDMRTADAAESIRAKLGCSADQAVLRMTTVLSLKALPLAITYSFFRERDVGWLREVAVTGRDLPQELTLPADAVQLAHSELSIETSQCGQFEADRFGIAHRSAVFLVLCTEFRRTHHGARTAPFEVARAEYRGDLIKFDLEVSPDRHSIQAVWDLTDRGNGLVGDALAVTHGPSGRRVRPRR